MTVCANPPIGELLAQHKAQAESFAHLTINQSVGGIWSLTTFRSHTESQIMESSRSFITIFQILIDYKAWVSTNFLPKLKLAHSILRKSMFSQSIVPPQRLPQLLVFLKDSRNPGWWSYPSPRAPLPLDAEIQMVSFCLLLLKMIHPVFHPLITIINGRWTVGFSNCTADSWIV